MKRVVYLLMFFILVSCGFNTANKEVINIYTWESFIPDEVIEDFEKESGIKVNLAYYDTNDAMLSKLLTGVEDYDIISPSTDFIPILKRANLLEKLDKSRFEDTFNHLTISNEIINSYDENSEYSLPYNLFATGITVIKGLFEIKDGSLDIFSNPEFKGRMTMLDDAREVIGLALQHLGYESDSKNDKELNEAKELILSWKANLAKFESVTYGKGLISGEFVAIHGYNDVFYEVEDEEAENYYYYLPKGAMMYIDTMAILKNAPHKENAYKFLEFLYRPENMKKVFDVFKTPSILDNVEPEHKPLLTIDYVLSHSKLPRALDDETKEKQDKIWTEIKLK